MFCVYSGHGGNRAEFDDARGRRFTAGVSGGAVEIGPGNGRDDLRLDREVALLLGGFLVAFGRTGCAPPVVQGSDLEDRFDTLCERVAALREDVRGQQALMADLRREAGSLDARLAGTESRTNPIDLGVLAE